MLGNPPWDTLSPDRKEFFSKYEPQVRFARKAEQDAMVASLLDDPAIASSWQAHQRELYALVRFLKSSGRYRLFAPGNLGKGDFNVYRMFIEVAMNLVRPGGLVGQVVPNGFYNGANAMAIRKELFENWEVRLVLGLINTGERWFRGVDATTRFAAYAARRSGHSEVVPCAFGIRHPEMLSSVMRDRLTELPVAAIRQQSPDALAIPEATDDEDAQLILRLHERFPSFGDDSAGPPLRHYMREVDMGNDRERFSDHSEGFPVYEGRMVDQYDYRAKAYRSGRGRSAVWELFDFEDQSKGIVPQWYVPSKRLPEKLNDRVFRYRIGFCDVTSPRNGRSLVAALIPPGVVCGHKVPTFTYGEYDEWAYLPWLAVANSFVMDYLIRKKVSLTVSFTVLDSMPFPRPLPDYPTVSQLAPLVLRLICTGPEMTEYWNRMSEYGWCERVTGDTPPGIMNADVREAVRAEIDAIVAHEVFGLARDELGRILDSFPVLERRERRAYGEYRTKRLVLERYDAIVRPMPQKEQHDRHSDSAVARSSRTQPDSVESAPGRSE